VTPLRPFAAVVGQERAATQLRAAVRAPVHAYLLVGPAGTGQRAQPIRNRYRLRAPPLNRSISVWSGAGSGPVRPSMSHLLDTTDA
jgi:hypothetical protein